MNQTIEAVITESEMEKVAGEIYNAICCYCSIDMTDVNAKSQRQEVIKPRQLSHSVIKEVLPKLSLVKIGNIVGKKDHTTVLHSCKVVRDLCETDLGYNLEFGDCLIIGKRIVRKYKEQHKLDSELLSDKITELLKHDALDMKAGLEQLISNYNLNFRIIKQQPHANNA